MQRSSKLVRNQDRKVVPKGTAVARACRTAVAGVLGSKRRIESLDVLFTLCRKRYNIDPCQLKLIWPFRTARRQVTRHQELRDLLVHTWTLTKDSRALMTTRPQLFGSTMKYVKMSGFTACVRPGGISCGRMLLESGVSAKNYDLV